MRKDGIMLVLNLGWIFTYISIMVVVPIFGCTGVITFAVPILFGWAVVLMIINPGVPMLGTVISGGPY